MRICRAKGNLITCPADFVTDMAMCGTVEGQDGM